MNILDATIQVIKGYAPTGKETNTILATDTARTNTPMARDFNAYHTMWYAEKATDRAELIKNSGTKADILINHIQDLGLTLQNIPGTYTHFPRAERYRASVPDLSLTSGHATTVVQGWSSNPTGGGNSDHALITTLLVIKKPTFSPARDVQISQLEMLKGKDR